MHKKKAEMTRLLSYPNSHTGRYGSFTREIFILKGRFTQRRQVCTPSDVAVEEIQIPVHVRM